MRIRFFLASGPAIVLVAGLAACSGASSAATTGTSADSATSTTGLTLVADTAALGDSVVAGTTVPVTVHVMQGATPAANVLVTWTVTAGGGAVGSATSVTDASGLATATWTVGDTVKTNTMTAVITGATVTINTVTVAGAVSSLARVSPDSQSIVAGAALTLTARPIDRFGNPVSGATVSWSASGGVLSATTTTSGNQGDATTNFVTNATPGTYLVTAGVAGKASVTFTVVGT
jgi:hypothetical protein